MRRAARRDTNEPQIVEAMRACGAHVERINDEGRFDLLVWYRGRTLLLEVKDGTKSPSQRALTPAEQAFHDRWPGDNLHIVENIDDALALLKATG